jgi:HAD superfamily hydrolase (TIGR01509 family)
MKENFAVIFDMDGVLLNSEPIYYAVEQKLYNEFGLPVRKEEHESFVGMSMEKIWQHLKAKYNLKEPIAELIDLHIDRMLSAVYDTSSLVPSEGIVKFIHELQQRNVKMAVATSTVRKLAVVLLEKIGLLNDFDSIVCGDEVSNGKPAPDIFLKAGLLLSMPPSQCVVIEDSANGVKAAKAAEMKCIGYQNPGSGEQNLEQADYVIADFNQLNWNKIVKLLETTIKSE